MSGHPSEEQLNRFADATLDPGDRAGVARHLEECAACREEVAGIRNLLQAVAEVPRVIEPSRDLWPEIREVLTPVPPLRSGVLTPVPTLRSGVLTPCPPLPSGEGGRRLSSSSPERRRGARTIRWGWAVGVAAAAALVVVGLQVIDLRPSGGGAWRVVSLAGTPRIGTAVVTGERGGTLRVGDWLETDSASRARVAVGRIGEVEVRPGTRVRLVEARPTSHRLALARGAIHARVDAPPRLFIVETPAGEAIDLGCAYTLEMDSLGNGRIHVTGGWVEFAGGGRRSIVPLGFTALTRPDLGPGTPAAADAPDSLRSALFAFDFGAGAPEAAGAALRAARAEDAVSVWHLLWRVDGPLRAEVYERLSALVPPPANVSRDAVLSLDAAAMERYWNVIRRIAWRREILRGVREIDPRTGLTR